MGEGDIKSMGHEYCVIRPELEFVRYPPNSFLLTSMKSQTQQEALEMEIAVLLTKQVLVKVPEHEIGIGFYSPLFLVPKPDGSYRTIINLKKLNTFLRLRSFKMESIKSAIKLLFPRCYMAVLDLKDAYYHLPIYRGHQRFLRVAVWFKGRIQHFQFAAMPFGLSVAPRLRGTHVGIQTDNTTAVAYINRQGGTRSLPLMSIAGKILEMAEVHLLSLSALHIRGVDNSRADYLSRQALYQGEWVLSRHVFEMIASEWGRPEIDLFATRANRRVKRFASLYRSDNPDILDALQAPWTFQLAYAFPPMVLLPTVVRKIRQERARVILIAPFWPKRPWFSWLRAMSVTDPWILPLHQNLLSQGPCYHPQAKALHLAAWNLKGSY
ncbi:uncharacterized protein [Dendrobates tinctorius]|uniref:uncharacterized protein n=1 Tax=Dendrobates tinctorius TaxID=92724 RepID=UPI003CC96C4E